MLATFRCPCTKPRQWGADWAEAEGVAEAAVDASAANRPSLRGYRLEASCRHWILETRVDHVLPFFKQFRLIGHFGSNFRTIASLFNQVSKLILGVRILPMIPKVL